MVIFRDRYINGKIPIYINPKKLYFLQFSIKSLPWSNNGNFGDSWGLGKTRKYANTKQQEFSFPTLKPYIMKSQGQLLQIIRVPWSV